MFRAIDFETIMAWLPDSLRPQRIPTLGGESFIVCYRASVDTMIVIGSNGKYKPIDIIFWQEICAIITEMRAKNPDNIERGIFYTNGSDRNFGPSVPAICRQYCIENNII